MASEDPGIPKGLVSLAVVANDDLCDKTPDLTYCCVMEKWPKLETRSWSFFLGGLCLSASKVMLKIFQARLQQYMNHELPDVQAGFRKGRGTGDQIFNIRWIMEKLREFQKNF